MAPRLLELAVEMQRLFFSDKSEISFEARKKGNSGYFLPTFLEIQEKRTDEWARRQYEIYCDCWYQQGGSITPEFVRAVSQKAIIPLIHIRKGSMISHLGMTANRTRESINQSALGEWNRSMERLANRWARRLEAEAKALEHNSHSLSAPLVEPVPQHKLEGLLTSCQARLTATDIELDAERQALTLIRANGRSASKVQQKIRSLSERRARLDSELARLKQLSSDQSKTDVHAAGESVRKARALRLKSPCFDIAMMLLRKNPDLTLVQFCREMDSKAEQYPSSLKYNPPETWHVRSFHEQYRKRSNTISRFLSEVRKRIKSTESQA